MIIALREMMVALLGGALFAIASPWAQGALIVALGSSLLMLPTAADRIGQHGFDGWRAIVAADVVSRRLRNARSAASSPTCRAAT